MAGRGLLLMCITHTIPIPRLNDTNNRNFRIPTSPLSTAEQVKHYVTTEVGLQCRCHVTVRPFRKFRLVPMDVRRL